MAAPTTPTDSRADTFARPAKDQLYLVRRGFMYAASSIATHVASGFPAIILLSTRREAFHTSTGERIDLCNAAAKRPMIERRLRAEHPIVSVGLSPNHPRYRHFRCIPEPGVLILPRDAFAQFDDALGAIAEGLLPIPDAFQLYEAIVETAVRFLPPPRHVGHRIAHALQILQQNPRTPLEQVANAVGLSYDRMSYLFAEAVGIPLRSFLLWQKIHIASGLLDSGLTITEIALNAGFADSAHLSNTWKKAYGVSPSRLFNNKAVQIHHGCEYAGQLLRTPAAATVARII